MDAQSGRAQVVVRCRWCKTALARMVPTPAAFRWQVNRVVRTREPKQPWMLGTARLGDRRYGLPNDNGTLPSPRMDPIPVWPPDAEHTSLLCRGSGCRFESAQAPLAELRARADQAERKGKRVVFWP
jgi:hypothetical protein